MDTTVADLIVANFYKKCPYLVPYYIPQEPGQTSQDYAIVCGYEVNSKGEIEDRERFLKKLSGITKLYASYIQAPIPPHLTRAAANMPHPHGIENGWKLFVRLLNIEPRPSITAQVIFDLLSVAGHALMKAYGRQFRKLLHGLCVEYVPLIERVTPPEGRAYTTRLKLFLEECITSGQIKVPEGYLNDEWWQKPPK